MRVQGKVVTEVWAEGEAMLAALLVAQGLSSLDSTGLLGSGPHLGCCLLQVLENMPSLGRYMCKRGALKHKPHVITVNLPPCKARVFKIAGHIQGTADCLELLEEC